MLLIFNEKITQNMLNHHIASKFYVSCRSTIFYSVELSRLIKLIQFHKISQAARPAVKL